ncbi:MAG TPA: hypothetical protein VGM56_30405 [Byssovorax sp.]
MAVTARSILPLAALACAALACVVEPPPQAIVIIPAAPREAYVPTPPAEGPRVASVTWTAVKPTPPTCFFFSGPAPLGRDDPLGDVAAWEATPGGRALLAFHGGPTFRGSVEGARVDLRRRSRHEYNNGWWTAEEELRGDLGAGALELDYTYEECQGDVTPCTGQCSLRAHVRVALSTPSR